MTELQTSIKKCTVQGNIVSLPTEILHNYSDVKKAFEKAGGKYKRNTFVFPDPAQPHIERLLNGDKVNVKKEFQFYASPPEIAKRLVELAEIEDGMTILEPEGGDGAIIEQIYKAFPRHMSGPNDKPCVTVDYYEIMPLNQQILSKKIAANVRWSSSTSFMGADFLGKKRDFKYDRVIANPPFDKSKYIDHIYEMYKVCKPSGRIVTCAPPGFQLSNLKKQSMFRQFITNHDAEIIELERGDFKESGTMIQAVIIVINKPK